MNIVEKVEKFGKGYPAFKKRIKTKYEDLIKGETITIPAVDNKERDEERR